MAIEVFGYPVVRSKWVVAEAVVGQSDGDAIAREQLQ